MTTHGKHNTVENRCWRAIIQRCTNKKNPAYKNYGERGISVCDRWRSFANFLNDMGEKPRPELTIERRDNNKGYEPGNCYWATRITQNRNMRPRKDSATGIIGVTIRSPGQYRASIKVAGRSISLGHFATIEAAAEARRLGEIKHRGNEVQR